MIRPVGYLIQQFIEKPRRLPAKGLGTAHASVAFPGAQLAIPVEPANGDKGVWRAVELSATLVDFTTVTHNHGEVNDGRAFRTLWINGYLLLMRFQGRLLSVL